MLLSWVWFRADDLTAASHYYAAMFGLGVNSSTSPLLAAGIYTPFRLSILAVCACWSFSPCRRTTGLNARRPGSG